MNARTFALGGSLSLVACGASVRGDRPAVRDAALDDVTVAPIEGCPSVSGSPRGRWEVIERPSAFSQRASATVLSLDRGVAVLGGYNTQTGTVTDNWLYEPRAQRWTQLASPWSRNALRYLAAAWMQDAREILLWLPREGDRQARAVRLALDGSMRDASREGFPSTVVQRMVSVAGVVFVAAGVAEGDHNEFALYDPRADRWEPVLAPREQNARGSLSLATDGRSVILWGGADATQSTAPARNDGWRFDVIARQWSSVAREGAPSPRFGHSALWIGDSMFVWGGTSGSLSPLAGGRYFTGPDQWLPVSEIAAPVAVTPAVGSWAHWAAWTGSDVLVWTLNALGEARAGRWDPRQDRWFAVEQPPDSTTRHEAASAWADCAMYVVGGYRTLREAFATEVIRWVP